MFRTLGVLVLAALGIIFVAMGGQVGPLDLTAVPLPLVGVVAVGGLLLLYV